MTFSNSLPLKIKACVPYIIPKVNNNPLSGVTNNTKNHKVPAELLKRKVMLEDFHDSQDIVPHGFIPKGTMVNGTGTKKCWSTDSSSPETSSNA
jgi:hypothetical protein